ncbi:hypothetical protein ATANTOWER_017651 [Ataeniobius toweri]|uniref:Secreted protein n=1 Tax=Ataeniobius toweri TaxID=208326 RepID=A0ABU7BS76_9TELE|nr:hypothetical protein [Ataeniobius toweri]
MRVGMCDCDCVCLFFVSGWVLGCSISWISLGPHRMWGLFPLTSALWLLGGSPGILPSSSGGGVKVVPAVDLPGFLCSGGPLDVCGSDLLCICPGSRGRVCGSLHSLLHIFMEKPCMHKRAHTQTHRCLDSGVNRYTNVLY